MSYDQPDDPCAICGEPLGDCDPHDGGDQHGDVRWCHPDCCPECSQPSTWTTEELKRDFEVRGFAAPYVIVTRRADGVKGTLQFEHMPRIYFGWVEAAS